MAWVDDEPKQGKWVDDSPEEQDWTWKQLGKTMTESLPMAGAAVGGAVGLPFGGVGAIGGAAGGAALGKSLENLIESYAFNEPKTIQQTFADPAMAALEGATSEMGGQVAGKLFQQAGGAINQGFRNLANKTQLPVQKPNADKIIAAAKELGIDVTPGMLDDSGFVERLESSLAKSPSILGRSVARDLESVRKGLQSASESVVESGTNLTPFQAGEKVKSALTQNIHERLDPLASTFQDVAESTRNIPLSEKSLSAIQRNAENLDIMQLGVGIGKAKEYVNAIPKLKNADQVKQLMTMLDADYRASMGAEKAALGAIKEKLATLERNSIMRSAIQAAKESGGVLRKSTGEQIGKEIVTDLQAARKGFRELAQGVGSVASDARIPTNNPTQFLDYVEQIPSEKIPQRFFNTENERLLTSLQEQFPDVYELLNKNQLGDIGLSAIDNSLAGQGQFSTQKFLNELRKLNPEAASRIFGENMPKIKNIEQVQQAFPRNFNPSGTASEAGFKDIIASNLKDIPNYLLYKGASSEMAQKFGQQLAKSPKMLELQKTNPNMFQQLVSRLTNLGTQQLNPNDEPVNKSQQVDKNKILQKTQGSKYSQVLQNAAEKGDAAFNAANFVLKENHPEYRQMLEESEQ